MGKVLKFRYFLVVCFFISCGETKEKQATKKTVDTSQKLSKEDPNTEEKVILFYGNSLTAAYGLDTKEGFPHLIQKRLDSLGVSFKAINAGLSGETTSGGLQRLPWVLEQDVAIFVLELGANDGLRGIPVAQTKENLQAIIHFVKEKNSNTKILLAGMQIPPNLGADYTQRFQNIYPELAKENNIHLIPFLLEGVAGVPQLNLEDVIHPTAEGQKIVMENVWEILKPLVITTEQSGSTKNP